MLISSCSLWIPRDPPIQQNKQDLIIETIQNAYSGIIYSEKTIPKDLSHFTSMETPSIPPFLLINTWAYIIGRVPYFTESWTIHAYEFFIGCPDRPYCASFYMLISEAPIMEYDQSGNLREWWKKIFSHTLRVRNGASPTLRLAKLLGTTQNQYFHWQYAMRLSDGRVVSLDPLDTDITDTGSLFKRLRIMDNPDITELTKLVHDRYYLSGGLTPVGAMHMNFWSGDEIFTGVLERSSDTWNIPKRITGRVMDTNKSYTDKTNMHVCYDAYERQLFYTWTTKPHGTIEHACGVDVWSNNDGTAMYVGLARLFGVVSFDQIMSRTTGVVFSESPWKTPCLTKKCPEDNEFIYGLE